MPRSMSAIVPAGKVDRCDVKDHDSLDLEIRAYARRVPYFTVGWGENRNSKLDGCDYEGTMLVNDAGTTQTWH